MNVILFSSGEGFGHIARAMPVADELEKRGHTPILCTYGEAAEKVREESHFKVEEVLKESTLIEKGGAVDIIKSIISSLILIVYIPINLAKALWIIWKYRADVTINDSHISGLLASIMLGVPVYSIFNCIHPHGAFSEVKGVSGTLLKLIICIEMVVYEKCTKVLICDFAPPNTIAKYNVEGFLPDITYVGPISRESPDNLPSAQGIKKGLALGKFILVTRGKYGKETEISDVLESLAKLTGHKIVVMGDASAKTNNLMMKKFVYKKYYRYLKTCDLVITHGGHSTMMECCIFGKPMVLIVTENYDERLKNGKGAEELGIAELIPYSKLSPKILHGAVDYMLKRKKHAEKFRELSKKEIGAVKVANILEREKAMRDMKRTVTAIF